MKYDALGNRVVKENPKHKVKEVYVRDAQGNILALYQVKNDSLYTKEFYMYGSQRLGYLEDGVFLGRKCISKWCNVLTPVLPMFPSTLSNSVSVVLGKKRYELSDWLGNVRVVINDRKTPINSGVATVGYKAQVINVNDYYSYGSTINERTYDYRSTKFRFAFNGKELDNEVYGFGNFQDYGARMYNTRLGRFISADPLIIGQKKYAWLSGYQFASNNPIWASDLDGLEADFKFDMYQRMKDAKTLGVSHEELRRETLKGIQKALTFTDLNDYFVLGTWASGDARNIDLSKADKWDKGFALAGMMLPFISGSALKTFVKEAFNITSDVLKTYKIDRLRVIGDVNNPKKIVIGRYQDRVEGFANEIGADTFKPSEAAEKELDDLKSKYGRNLTDEEFKGTRMYKENMDWIEEKLKEGYTVIDIGSLKGATKSVSYEGEKSKIREYLKNQKNEN